LKRQNKSQFFTPGKLANVQKDLPRTIADAMTLVSQIGERYLWVDSLCLVQDDELDKACGVQKMDLVYQGAILTVVAASGMDSNTGLPELHPGFREVIQWVEEVKPGVKMNAVSALFFQIE
jgi:hypothetical protein